MKCCLTSMSAVFCCFVLNCFSPSQVFAYDQTEIAAALADITACTKEVAKIAEEGVSSQDLGLMLSACLGKKKSFTCPRSKVKVEIDPEDDNDIGVCVACGNAKDCNDCCDTMFHWFDNTIRNGKCGRACNSAFPKSVREIAESSVN